MACRISCIINTGIKPVAYTQVRYRKSRTILPRRAPSKPEEFYKPKPTKIDVKNAEILYAEYNRALQSISAAFQEQILIRTETNQTESDSIEWNEEEHHKKCIEFNNKENKRLAELRDERIAVANQPDFYNPMEGKQNALEQEISETNTESKNWINLENLSEKIEDALENPVSYNFSIRFNGIIGKRLKGY